MTTLTGIGCLNRALISVKGKDATKFLNGLTTSRMLPSIEKKKQYTISDADSQSKDLSSLVDIDSNWGLLHEDIYDPEKNIFVGRDGIYSMMLNSKGRVITDSFLFAYPFHNVANVLDNTLKQNEYILEVDKKIESKILMLLKLHKLNAKVEFELKDLYSYYFYCDTPEFDEYLENIQEQFFRSQLPQQALKDAERFMESELLFRKDAASVISGFAFDNRIPNFGVKILTNAKLIDDNFNAASVFSERFLNSFDPPSLVEENNIIQRRFLNGLYEVSDTMKNISMLPFEANIDYTNGISLDKGCYVGQELTIRTYSGGVIRKRIFPIQFFAFTESNIEQMRGQNHISLHPHDPIIEVLKVLNEAGISKMDVQPLLLENTRSEEAEMPASSPFGSSNTIRRRVRSTGKIVSIKDNLGFAVMIVNDLKHNDIFKIEIPGANGENINIGLKVFTPEWWP